MSSDQHGGGCAGSESSESSVRDESQQDASLPDQDSAPDSLEAAAPILEGSTADSDATEGEIPEIDAFPEITGPVKREEDATKSDSSTSTVRETAEEKPTASASGAAVSAKRGKVAGAAAKARVVRGKISAPASAAVSTTLMKKAFPSARQVTKQEKRPSMMRINQQPSLHQSLPPPSLCRQDSFGEGIKTGPSGSDNDSDSEISDAEQFLAKGAFLLTPSHELSLEKASAICEKMNFNAPFSLTKTATGILFKFARPEDYQATFKKGFHKVTGARFYKKIPIPCRPQKTFTVFVMEVPEEVPEEDIRHALYKHHSVVEVVRLAGTGGPAQLALQKEAGSGAAVPPKPEKAVGSTSSGSTVELGAAGPPPIIRVTLANLDEYNLLLQNGLDFYGATFFPTEAASPSGLVRVHGRKSAIGNRILDVVTASGQRVRDLLPVFDSAGFSKIPPPAMKTIKPRPN